MPTAVKWGPETLANTTTAGAQEEQAVTALASGGFVVTWNDNSQTGGDTSGPAIRAQIYDALGVKVGGEFLVNTQTSGTQRFSDIAPLDDGGFVVVWTDEASVGDGSFGCIKAQRFSATGTKVGSEFVVNTNANNPQEKPSVAALDSGGYAVVWTDFSGVGDGDGLGSGVKMQRFSDAGAKLGGEVVVPTTLTLSQSEARIAAIGSERFVVVWVDTSATGGDMSGTAIRMQIFNDDGTPHGTEKLVNIETDFDQTKPTVTGLGNGNFVVAWEDLSLALDSDFHGVVGRMFDEEGDPIGDDFLINTTTTDSQVRPDLAANGTGGFFSVWADYSTSVFDVRAQFFTADGTTTPAFDGSEFLVNTITANDQSLPTVTRLEDGRYVVAWRDVSQTAPDTTGGAVRFQIIDARGGIITGASGNFDETLVGSTPGGAIVNDTISGFGGGDTIYGLDGNDLIFGGNGGDTIDGGEGDDAMNGGADNDDYYVDSAADSIGEMAGGGTDDVFASVTYSIATNIEVENITLIGTANINATGNTNANVLTGNSGNNVLSGGGGTDTMAGGLGNDTYVTDGGDTITEAASAGTDTVQSALDYTLGANLENLTLTGSAINGTGNTLNNTINGNANNNTLTGGDGNDVLNGLGGADTQIGGAGNDTFHLDVAGDVVVEAAGGGIDLVRTLVSITALGANLENVQLNGVGNFLIVGNTLNNTMNGNSGINQLRGMAGNDILFGFDGNDVLLGGGGKDQMAGGTGDDDFHFDALADMGNTLSTRDVITDFAAGADDLDFNTMDANSTLAGNQNFTWRSTGAFTAAGQLRYVQQAGGPGAADDKTIVQGNLDANLATVEFEIELRGLLVLGAGDIVL